jgi:hypothetical protein
MTLRKVAGWKGGDCSKVKGQIRYFIQFRKIVKCRMDSSHQSRLMAGVLCCTIACSNGHTDMDGWKSLDNAAWLHVGSHTDGHLWDMQHSNTVGGSAYASPASNSNSNRLTIEFS